uniref:hypothetical protein n=1 Tax=Sphingomonas bacterium TaxID=1895847 RepID=UPI002624D0FF|nr:hypothetical protein [Sphingomonas bacterium]
MSASFVLPVNRGGQPQARGVMSDRQKKQQYLAWAARARQQADEATTAAARAIHLEIARDYEAKAAAAPDTAPGD